MLELEYSVSQDHLLILSATAYKMIQTVIENGLDHLTLSNCTNK